MPFITDDPSILIYLAYLTPDVRNQASFFSDLIKYFMRPANQTFHPWGSNVKGLVHETTAKHDSGLIGDISTIVMQC